MNSFYEDENFLVTRGILKEFVKLDPVRCVNWVLSLTEPQIDKATSVEGVEKALDEIKAAIQNPKSHAFERVYNTTWKAGTMRNYKVNNWLLGQF
ncbi:MAG: hypothetical protein AAGI38_18165 [Bacteroidota bacterium]